MPRTSASTKTAQPASTSAPAVARKVRTPAPAAAPAKKTRPAASRIPTATPAKAPAPAPEKGKEVKARKPKLVRDSFTIPKDEYAAIEALKMRTTRLAQPAKKSELLRAGLKLLAQLDDAALGKAMQAVPAIKTGRPKADKK